MHTRRRFALLRSRLATVRAALCGVVLVCACEGETPPLPTDSALAVPGVDEPARVTEGPVSSGWDLRAGPFLVLPTIEGGTMTGSLMLPEATDLTVGDTAGVGEMMGDGRLELFARSGSVGIARLSVEGAPRLEAGCTAWPIARLAVDAGVTVSHWTAAFTAGQVTAIPLDSIEGFAPRDSARLVTDLARLASGMPNDTSRTFRGLPFVVLRAWRSRGLDSGFVVATLVRRVNQEDAPKEERVVLVVDTPTADAKSWTVGWHERADGFEDELVVAEPLLAFVAKGARDVRLLFGRDDGVALGAAVLSRSSGRWQVLWESAIAGCN